MTMLRVLALAVAVFLLSHKLAISEQPAPAGKVELERGLLGHWPLSLDAQDRSPHKRHGLVHGDLRWVTAETAQGHEAAEFNGRDAFIEIPAAQAPRLGSGDFSLSARVYTAAELDDVPGDVLSLYDASARRGLHLSIKTSAGVTTTQANARQLQFGIDNGQSSEWSDVGRPGNALLAFALTTFQGKLFAGTCEPGKTEQGRVYQYAGGQDWKDLGAPDKCNAVTALAEWRGGLYAASGKYRVGGSALPESENTNLGGGIYRWDGAGGWIDCGRLPGVEAIGGLVVYRDRLYASSLYKPAGFFRYEGDQTWTSLPTPGVRVEALGVYNGYLYATSYDAGRVYRFDGESWTDCGQLGGADENSQTYSFAVYQGRLLVGTWRSGKVYRFEDVDRWTDVGRLGQELEVMGMLVHNGRLIAGTLPLAEMYEYQGDANWKLLTRLDHTPDVTYRRAWTLAEFDGGVFASTLPSGKIYRAQFGASAMSDAALAAGWHSVAAIKSADRLRLFVDGKPMAERSLDRAHFDLNAESALRIGFGENDFFCGQMADVRVYDRALSDAEIRQLTIVP